MAVRLGRLYCLYHPPVYPSTIEQTRNNTKTCHMCRHLLDSGVATVTFYYCTDNIHCCLPTTLTN